MANPYMIAKTAHGTIVAISKCNHQQDLEE